MSDLWCFDLIRVACCVTTSEVVGIQGKKTSGPPKGVLPKAKKQKELPHPSNFKAEDLEQYFKGLFSIVDANGDGVLQPDELKMLLGLCGFALSAEEIAQL